MTGNLATKMASNSYFSMHDMHAYYGESYIVQGVSLDVNEGEILALLGRNGAGKTSTLRAIARLDDPQLRQGEIWLDGQSLHNMSSHQAAVSGVSLVPEDRRIIQGLTVEENIQLAQIVEPVGWSIERLYDLFPRLGERRKQEGVTLSGGEQQMLSIARALARDIKLLLLDEPYEGLAPVIVDEIEKTLRLMPRKFRNSSKDTDDENMEIERRDLYFSSKESSGACTTLEQRRDARQTAS